MYYCEHKKSDHCVQCNCQDPCTTNKCFSKRQSGRKRNFERLRKQWSLVGKTGENCFCKPSAKNEDFLYPSSATLCGMLRYFEGSNSTSCCSKCNPEPGKNRDIAYAKNKTPRHRNEAISSMDNSESSDCLRNSFFPPKFQEIDIEREDDSDSSSATSSGTHKTTYNSEMIQVTIRSKMSQNFIRTSECRCHKSCKLVELKKRASVPKRTSSTKCLRNKKKPLCKMLSDTSTSQTHTKVDNFAKTFSGTFLKSEFNENKFSKQIKTNYSREMEVTHNESETFRRRIGINKITAKNESSKVLSKSTSNCSDKTSSPCEQSKIRQHKVALLKQTSSTTNKNGDKKALSKLTGENRQRELKKLQYLDKKSTDTYLQKDMKASECNNEKEGGSEQKQTSNFPDMETKCSKNETVTTQSTANTINGEREASILSIKSTTSHGNIKELPTKTSTMAVSAERSEMYENKSTSLCENQINKETKEQHKKDEINCEKRLKVSCKAEKEIQFRNTDRHSRTQAVEEIGDTEYRKEFCAFDIRHPVNEKVEHKNFTKTPYTCLCKEKPLQSNTKATQKSFSGIINKACQIPSNCQSKKSKKNLSHLSAGSLESYTVKQYKSDKTEGVNGISRNRAVQVILNSF